MRGVQRYLALALFTVFVIQALWIVAQKLLPYLVIGLVVACLASAVYHRRRW